MLLTVVGGGVIRFDVAVLPWVGLVLITSGGSVVVGGGLVVVNCFVVPTEGGDVFGGAVVNTGGSIDGTCGVFVLMSNP